MTVRVEGGAGTFWGPTGVAIGTKCKHEQGGDLKLHFDSFLWSDKGFVEVQFCFIK